MEENKKENIVIDETIEQNKIDEEEQMKKKDLRLFSRYAGMTIVLILALTIFRFTALTGPSMFPTHKGKGSALMLRDKWIEKYERFDIVAFKHDVEGFASGMMKRIVGLPGEKIQYIDHVLYVNDVKVENPHAYIEEGTEDLFKTTVEWTLGENEYFMVGDNLCNSADSRYYGPFNRDLFWGKHLFAFTF